MDNVPVFILVCNNYIVLYRKKSHLRAFIKNKKKDIVINQS